MKPSPPNGKDKSADQRKDRKWRATSSRVVSVATVGFYIMALAFLSFTCVWFFCIRPPRNPEEFLLLWLILFLGGLMVFHLRAKNE